MPNQYGGRENLEAIDFLRELNTLTHQHAPGTVMIAEESTAFPAVSRPTWVGGLGFTYKWNMGWMHDILTYVSKDPVYRRWEHRHLTFSMLYAWNENFILPFSHDEVVHGKGAMVAKIPGDAWQKSATLRTLYGFMYAHPGKKLLFMGSEFGQWHEWNHDASLDWHLLDHPLHAGLQHFVEDLNALYAREPALHEVDFESPGFEWIDCNDYESSVISLHAPRASGRRARRGRAQLDAARASELPRGRARARLLPRVAQQRRVDVRRQQRRQRRRPRVRARPGARAPAVARAHDPAAGRAVSEARCPCRERVIACLTMKS